MKKILYLLFLLPVLAMAQTPATTENYIWNKTYKVPTLDGTTATDGSGAVTAAKKTQTITYYDGLGRPKQKNDVQQGPSGNDIITPITYDAFGRQEKQYLPYYAYSNNGYYADNATVITNIGTQYYDHYTQSVPYSQKAFEASPLNRVLKQSAPGNDWAMDGGHEIKSDYLSNVANEVKLYVATAAAPVNGVYNPTLTQTTYYAANQLYKTITKDENWTSGKNHTTEEFKDKQGRIILKRSYSDYRSADGLLISTQVAHDTYYVYDQYGNLSYVIPPLVTNPLIFIQRDNLCYQYKYDLRNRLVEKRIPGKQWEFIVYDKLDRVIATGPAFSPFSDSVAPNHIGWLVTKYDVFNRPVITGWMAASNANTSAARHTLQTERNDDAVISESRSAVALPVNGVGLYYSIGAWPKGTTPYHLLTVNYYDDYQSGVGFSPAISYSIPTISPNPVYYNNSTMKPKGLPTVNLTRILSTTTVTSFEKSYTLYDRKARPVRTFTNNQLGGYTQVDSQIDFAGRTLKTETYQKRSSEPELKITEWFTYSDQDRLMYHAHQVNNNPAELLVENSYNHIGVLAYKKVGNVIGSPLQKVDYNYNIRGWLTGINNSTGNMELNATEKDLFAFKLNYNTTEAEINYSGTPLFNGNISESYWRTSADNIQRKYGYRYDNLNRLVEAIYQRPGTGVTNSYNEGVAYDRNGNITELIRFGDFDSPSQRLEIDRLSYAYSLTSNRLMRVTDLSGTYNTPGFKDGTNTADDFAYDANGNMITDLNKGINSSGTNPIKYNHLNLPTEIVFSVSPLKKINYLYDATGVKLQKTVSEGTVVTTTDYLDGFQYVNAALQYFPTAEGYVNYNSGVYKYVYNYLDHLGNIRMSYTSDVTNGGLAILEENHYYPFGLKHTNYNVEILRLRGRETEIEIIGQNKYKYKYNGKEHQNEFGLNLYDYGARNYDPAIGRWMNIDPLAETSRRFSPFAYALNNPMYFIDPDGMEAETVIVTGDAAKQATQDLNNSSSLNITMDKDGKLSATGNAETKADKELLKAINDKNITVNVNATYSNSVTNSIGETKDLLIGAFQGSTVNPDGTVDAHTSVNPNQTTIAGAFYEADSGTYIAHEILESYNAAKDSPGTQSVSNQDVVDKTPAGKAYLNAHAKAIRQDKKFVEPTFVGDQNDNTYYLRKMKNVPGGTKPYPFEQKLFTKK